MARHGPASGSFTTIGTFGELLKALRRRAELTQRELGAAVGYSDTYITRLERNERHPDVATVTARFIGALGLAHEPELASRLIELAGQAAMSMPPSLTASLTQPSGNLLVPLTHFIGRAHEMHEVEHLLATTRLLTLTGSGGCGKTRLALAVGATLVAANAYPDGVWLVGLAPLAQSSFVAETVLSVLGLQAMSRPAQAVLTDHLRDLRLLLILDNCEHLIEACAELAEALLQACPQLRILATSREGLNIAGEVTWRVPPLAVDEAVQLFAERASAAKPGFAITAANRAWVEQICRRLDDMPLAIELAAARVRAFSVEQLAARMDDVFRVLTGGSRTALPRQQTLRATIDWSYSLLPEPERALLRGLSVFAGGWTLEAVEGIHGTDALARLDQLVNKSLVVVDEVASVASVPRYHLLETIRQYVSEALRLANAETGEEIRIRQRHLEYFAELSQSATLHSADGFGMWIWDAALAAELDNTRAALSWAAQSGAWRIGWRLIVGIHGVWAVLGYGDELSKWITAIVLANPVASETARVRAMLALASLAHTKGDIVEGFERYREASAQAHRLADEGLMLRADLWLGADTPDYEQAITLLNHVVQGAHRAGRKITASLAMSMLGDRMRIQGDFQGATDMLTGSVTLVRETGNRGYLAGHLGVLARLYISEGNYAEAGRVLEESITINRQERLQGYLEDNMVDLAAVGLYQGNAALVREALHECIPYFHRVDDLESVARGVVLAAGLAHTQGELMPAARLLAAAAAIRRDHHTHGVYERDHFAEYDRRLPAVRAELDPAAFERTWAEGQCLTLNHAIQAALAV